jgi:ketosteroid isomerase-like protein
MMSADLRAKLYDLYAAFGEGKIDFVLKFFDEMAVFTSYTPIDVFPYLGRQIGKTAIAAMMTNMHAQFEHLTFHPIFMVAEKDSAAVIIMARLRQRSTDRIIQLLTAHFIQFRDGNIIELREFMDSFDAVQQVLGRELDIPKV